MNKQVEPKIGRISCSGCPLRSNSHFREFDDKELEFVSNFKTGEFTVNPGATLMMEGARSAHLYTVLSGWAFRSKVLEDGRRQILNYVLPGDLIGLQGSLLGEMQHTVEALTPLTVCVFERSRLADVWERFGSLAYDVTWIAAREERILDEHLLSVGRRTALERAAYLLAYLHQRVENLQELAPEHRLLPVTQTHVADTLGLSLVHTNKTLRKLVQSNLIRWMDSRCEVLDIEGLQRISGWKSSPPECRPFL
ncbi:Crp/Fnr family transcriptional regulator [Rhodobacterales bacterium]|nr:Crp/Fnr family transcriptional regulator [Rhodobacterales bacterium]